MFNFFRNTAAVVAIAGIFLIVLSFFVGFSLWFGIELVKSSFFLLLLAVFVQLFEHEPPKRCYKKV